MTALDTTVCRYYKELEQNGLDQTALLDHVRKMSMNDLRRSPSYKFSDMAVKATTESNNGMIFNNGIIYLNKCFFISFCDAMKAHGICINVVDLVRTCRMLNNHIVDTANEWHKHFIECITQIYNAKIEFYIGQLENDIWYTLPDHPETFGKGQFIVRILNKGLHFENLVNIEGGFLKNNNDNKITNKVNEMEENKRKREEEESLALARRLHEEEIRNAKIYEEQIHLKIREEVIRQLRIKEEQAKIEREHHARILEEARQAKIREQERQAKIQEAQKRTQMEADYQFALKMSQDMTNGLYSTNFYN